jgi:hypothetical protein
MPAPFSGFADMLADAARRVRELMPWNLRDRLAAEPLQRVPGQAACTLPKALLVDSRPGT